MRRVNSGYVIIDKQNLLNMDGRNAMNIFQLVCFLAVAENLSFARAAEQLHITQPAVTQQIRTLEKELGARLFIRTTRSVKLTEEGKSFFIDARQMVEISERAKKRFENPFGTEIATLAIGCSNLSVDVPVVYGSAPNGGWAARLSPEASTRIVSANSTCHRRWRSGCGDKLPRGCIYAHIRGLRGVGESSASMHMPL